MQKKRIGARSLSQDYLATIPPPAQKLLRAARRLLIRKGFGALSWESIAKEAGVQKSLIRYYFHDKAGLLRALLQVVSRDALAWLVDQAEALPQGPARIQAHVAATLELTRNPQFLSFLDIVPQALRQEELRPPMAELYRWAREMNVRCFGLPVTQDNVQDLEAVASLFMAATDGIAIQAALDPEGYDPVPAFNKLEQATRLLLHLQDEEEPQKSEMETAASGAAEEKRQSEDP